MSRTLEQRIEVLERRVEHRERKGHGTRIMSLREELDLTDKLLQARMEAIDKIPPCPCHGSQCLPWAEKWIDSAKRLIEMVKKIEWIEHDEAFMYCPGCHSVQEGGHDEDCILALALTPLVMGE